MDNYDDSDSLVVISNRHNGDEITVICENDRDAKALIRAIKKYVVGGISNLEMIDQNGNSCNQAHFYDGQEAWFDGK